MPSGGGGLPFHFHPRLPDYITIDASFTLAGFPIAPLIGGGLTFTRQGRIFVTLETGAGIMGATAGARAGWIDQSKPARAANLNSFIGKWSEAASAFVPVYPAPLLAGVGPQVAETWGNPGRTGGSNFATELGAGVGGGHDLSGIISYSWLLPPQFGLPGW